MRLHVALTLSVRWILAPLLAAAWLTPTIAFAGMPSALREDFETVLRLRESPHQRFQAISFFLMGIFVSTLVVQFLWNFVAKDFPRLPRLSFLRALSVVLLWGLLFVIVLTMISGARELMTPGAWKKDGLTYSVDDAVKAESPKRSPP
jgi:hypothetical protein